jgi:DNA-binding MarR family transcriptional regulator
VNADGPDDSPVGPDEVAPLQEVAVRLARRLRIRSRTTLTLAQMSALTTLERIGPMPVSDLARREQVNPSSVTRLIANLERMGYLIRETNPDDGRSAVISISTEGTTFLNSSRRRANEALAHDVARLSHDDQQHLMAALPALLHLIALRRDTPTEESSPARTGSSSS